MVRQIFKNKFIAAAGPLPGQLTVDNLKHWTRIRKGHFSDDFDDNITHLLCTKEQFNKKVPRIREALKRGKSLHIVHYDWFEFSVVQEKRQPEREYSMRNILAKQNAAKREQARIERGKRNGEKFVNTNFFHIYIDREFFPYQIELTRDDEVAGEFGQKYTLCLWESDAKPHLYWFTARFLKKKGSSQPSYHRPSPHSGKWRVEMGHFMDFFKIKTGINWEDRVTKMQTMPTSCFQYTPPGGGKPVGRRLRFDYEYCRQVNAEIRGIPWPPSEDISPGEEETHNAGPVVSEMDEGSEPDAETKDEPTKETEHGDEIEDEAAVVTDEPYLASQDVTQDSHSPLTSSQDSSATSNSTSLGHSQMQVEAQAFASRSVSKAEEDHQ